MADFGWGQIGAAGISALANLGGGLISAGGQAAANAQQIEAARSAQMASQDFNADQGDITRAMQQQMFQDTNAFNAHEAEVARGFNAEQAELNRKFQQGSLREQREFEEMMSSTAYQRAMKDMKMAGLNPILAAGQGGASTPSVGAGAGSMASSPMASGAHGGAASAGASPVSPGSMMNTQSEIGRAIGLSVKSALDAATSYEGVNLMQQQNKESQQREVVGAADARLKHWDAEYRERETKLKDLEVKDAEKHGTHYVPNTIERILRALGDMFTTGQKPPTEAEPGGPTWGATSVLKVPGYEGQPPIDERFRGKLRAPLD